VVKRDQYLSFYLNSPIRKISCFISLNPATTPLIPRYGTKVPNNGTVRYQTPRTERHRTLRTLVTSALTRHQVRVPTVEARIDHFLSSLPEEAIGYEDVFFDLNGAPKPPIRSSTMPDLPDTQLKHSKSQETF
jgi:hypothetical protein